jgi:hypothetical protein
MDGILPSIPTQPPAPHQPQAQQFPQPFGQQPQQQAPPQGQRPVGRPSSDEAQQEQRVVRSAELKRLEAALPKQATDSKIQVYRISGPDGKRVSLRSAHTILISEIEEATAAAGVSSEEYITEALRAKFGEGKFNCRVFDRSGKPVLTVQPFTINLDEDDDDVSDDDGQDEDGGYEEDARDDPRNMGPQIQTYAPPAPPATFDAASYAALARKEREDEGRRGSDLMAVMMQSQQSSTQMMTLLMQQQQQAQQAAQESARQASEAAAARSSEMWKVLITTLAPIVVGLMTPKESLAEKLLVQQMAKPAPGISPEMTMMLKMMEDKNAAAPELMKQMLTLQTAAATSAIETQSKLTSTVIDGALARMRDLKGSDSGGDSGGGTMETIAKFAGPVIAAMMSRGQAAAPAEAFAPEQQLALPAPEPAPAPAPAPAPRRVRTPTPAAAVAEAPTPAAVAAPAPAAVTPPAAPVPAESDDRRIQSCLLTVSQLSTGKIPPAARWDALRWCITRMPAAMLEAVKADKSDDVLKLGTNAVLTEPTLIEWFGKPSSEGFLRECLSDMRLLTTGALTPEIANAAIQKQAAFVAGAKTAPVDAVPVQPADDAAAIARAEALHKASADAPPAPPAPPAGPEDVVIPPGDAAPVPEAKAKAKGKRRSPPAPAAPEA